MNLTTCLPLFLLLPALAATPRVPPPREAPAKPPPESPAQRTVKRELKRRTLRITDAEASTIPTIHVSGGVPTTLAFRAPINSQSIILADPTGVFPQETRTFSNSIFLAPRADVSESAVVTLQVTLTDGTLLPFRLESSPTESDLLVDVEVAFEQKAGSESLQAQKNLAAQLRVQLEECTASSDKAALMKLTSFILKEDQDRPHPAQRFEVHKVDKQNRLLVSARQAYRLFGYTFIVLTVQNRDPVRPWTLDRPGVSIQGKTQTEDIPIASWAAEPTTLNPDEVGRIVFGFIAPQDSHELTVTLLERNGSRNVKLEGVPL